MHRFPGRLPALLATLLVTLLATLLVGPVAAATHYVAPLGTVITGLPDGTEARPFASLPAALASGKVKGGDTLLLKSGAYGDLVIKANAVFDMPVTIMSQTDRLAHFDSILVAGTSRNLILQNLSVWPRDPLKGLNYLVRSYATATDITVKNLVIRSDRDAGQFMSWDAAKWEARPFSGILLQGDRSTAVQNKLTGVNHGVMVGGVNSKVLHNLVNGYNGDGLRAVGDHNLVKGNRVLNCVKTNANHDDGFQSFAGTSGVVKGLVVDSNVIIEWAGDPGHPLRCTLQGIGLFDGFYDNLRIVNNLVAVSAPHGIAVYGGRNAVVANNTLVNARGVTSKYPWLMVNKHKNGTPSSNVLVANNVAMSFGGVFTTADLVVFRNNSVVGTPGAVFVSPATFDYRPRNGSGLIDTADKAAAPLRDVLNQVRPSGVAPDRGAYEIQIGTTDDDTAKSILEESIGGAEAGSAKPPLSMTITAKRIRAP